MVRIAYFGTDGCPGHYAIPIRGKFTEEDIKVIESVDCDDFYKVFDVMRFKIAEFKGWTILGIPASLDDHRPGSKTVIFIEGEANEADFTEVTQEYSFLKNKVKKLAELYHDGEWLATGKLNQDPPTNKERFQFTLDKDDIINMIRGVDLDPYMELKDFKDVVRVMTKEEFESTINEDIKFVEGFKNFLKHDDATRIVEHIKSVLEASVDYYYPNHPEVEFEKDFNIQYDVNNILNKYGHTEMGMYKIQLYIENILGSIQNKKPVDVGEVSDGYHTFNELYRYRMLYNAAFFNLLARSGQVEVCKSRRHSDGEKCFGSDDWFIVMAILPTGQVSNHYESKYWDLFDVPERETAFEYDGHTPNEAADRLKKYLKLPRRGMTFEQALERLKLGRKIKRIDWGKKYICMFDVNILMIDTGQKVASNWNPTEHDIMSNDWEIAG